MVASSDAPVRVRVLVDGKSVEHPGLDVEGGFVTISQSRLYRLVEDAVVGEHTLELIIESPGVEAYTFTFG